MRWHPLHTNKVDSANDPSTLGFVAYDIKELTSESQEYSILYISHNCKGAVRHLAKLRLYNGDSIV